MSSVSGARAIGAPWAGAGSQVRRLYGLSNRGVVWLCVALLGVDLFFVAVHAAHDMYAAMYTDRVPVLHWQWDIIYDRSYLEIFGYLKTLAIVGLLLATPGGPGRLVYRALAIVFVAVLLDDALMVHETLGQRLADALALRPFVGLRPADYGELLVWAGAGMLLTPLAAIGLVKSSGRDRANGLVLLGALAALMVFAAGIDMVHVVVEHAFRGSGLLFTVIEEGGQQITLSLSCGLAILIRREVRQRTARAIQE